MKTQIGSFSGTYKFIQTSAMIACAFIALKSLDARAFSPSNYGTRSYPSDTLVFGPLKSPQNAPRRQASARQFPQTQHQANIPVSYFSADSAQQDFVVGSKAFYRLLIKDWKPKIQSLHRGAELYGGPLWSVSYSKQGGSLKKTLAFKKQSNARLGIHPSYAIQSTSDANLKVEHKLIPMGFKLIDQATLTNHSLHTLTVWHYQLWDMYLKPIVSPLVTTLVREIPGSEELQSFMHRVAMIEKETLLTQNSKPYGLLLKRHYPQSISLGIPRPDRHSLSPYNYYPANSKITFSHLLDIFNLSDLPVNPGSDEAMRRESLLDLFSHEDSYGPVWVGLSQLTLSPGQTQVIESTHQLDTGQEASQTPEIDDSIVPQLSTQGKKRPSNAAALTPAQISSLAFGSHVKSIQSELAYTLEHVKALSTWDETTKKRVTTQGAFYLDQFGVHTAFRDFTNVVAGISKRLPGLAKSNLEYCLMLQGAWDSYLPYLWEGNFKVRRELKMRSDLGPSLIWATLEWMKSSADWTWFYQSQIPFYPPTSHQLPKGAEATSAFDHVKAAFYLLRDQVGLGSNQLPHTGMGDWSDALLTLAGDETSLAFYKSIAFGESPMVGQMALLVLTDLLNLLEASPNRMRPDHIQFVRDVNDYLNVIRPAVRAVYDANVKRGYPFFPRAILRDNDGNEIPALFDTIDVAAQVWDLMGGFKSSVLTQPERDVIIELILKNNLTDIGVRTVTPPNGAQAAYFRLQGRPWSVIRAWFTKALAVNGRLSQATQHLYQSSLTHHNALFADKTRLGKTMNPLVSGFDGWSPDGLAWSLPNLDMNEARWNNANHPALFLWASDQLLEQAGLELNQRM